MRHLMITIAISLATTACGVGAYGPGDGPAAQPDVETDTDELRFARMRPIQAPTTGYACRFHFPQTQDLSSGRMIMDAEIYTQPGCRGSFVGRRRVVEELSPAFVKLTRAYPELGVVRGTGAVAEVPPEAVLLCNGQTDYRPGRGELFDIWGGEWSCVDIGDNGILSCHEDLGGLTIDMCGEMPGGPGQYDCGWKWWEAGQCALLSFGSEVFHVPGVSEAVAAIRSGAYQTLATILASNLGALVLEHIGVIPLIDSCACAASEFTLGCGLNLNESLSFARDLARQEADTPCSYGH